MYEPNALWHRATGGPHKGRVGRAEPCPFFTETEVHLRPEGWTTDLHLGGEEVEPLPLSEPQPEERAP